MRKYFVFRLAMFFFIVFFISPDVMAQGTMLLRQPTVSQYHIVFVHADDLWIVSREGGDARRLTTAMGSETSPRLSADGKWVAFTGQYDGNTDVYIVPVEGGGPKRLTWHPSADVVQGWMPDGKSVYFTSGREGVPTLNLKFYKVNIGGGTPEPLVIPFGYIGSLSQDGNLMAYQPYSFWDPEWRNYRGGQAQPIWIFNMKTHETIKTPRSDNERHMNPVWENGIVYFLSELDFIFDNNHAYSLQLHYSPLFSEII